MKSSQRAIRQFIYGVRQLKIPQEILQEINDLFISGEPTEQEIANVTVKHQGVFLVMQMFNSTFQILMMHEQHAYVVGLMEAAFAALLMPEDGSDPMREVLSEAQQEDIDRVIKTFIEKEGEMDVAGLEKSLSEILGNVSVEILNPSGKEPTLIDKFEKVTNLDISDFRLDFKSVWSLISYAVDQMNFKSAISFIALIVGLKNNEFDKLGTCDGDLNHFHLDHIEFGIINGTVCFLDNSEHKPTHTPIDVDTFKTMVRTHLNKSVC